MAQYLPGGAEGLSPHRPPLFCRLFPSRPVPGVCGGVIPEALRAGQHTVHAPVERGPVFFLFPPVPPPGGAIHRRNHSGGISSALRSAPGRTVLGGRPGDPHNLPDTVPDIISERRLSAGLHVERGPDGIRRPPGKEDVRAVHGGPGPGERDGEPGGQPSGPCHGTGRHPDHLLGGGAHPAVHCSPGGPGPDRAPAAAGSGKGNPGTGRRLPRPGALSHLPVPVRLRPGSEHPPADSHLSVRRARGRRLPFGR